MKLFFCVLSSIFIWGLAGCANMETLPEGQKTVEQVFEVPGKSKDQIFDATQVWIAQNFKSANSVIQLANKEGGLIVGNGIVNYPCAGGSGCVGKAGWRVGFTMQFDAKDGRFKLLFTNIRLLVPGQPGIYPAAENPIAWKEDMDKIRPELIAIGNQVKGKISGVSDW